MVLDLAEDGRRLHVWAEAKDDNEAAVMLGTTKVGWIRWRNSRGLPSKSVFKAADYLAAWRKAASDPEAALALAIETDAFRAWRRKMELPPCLGNKNVKHVPSRTGKGPVPRQFLCSNCKRVVTQQSRRVRLRTCGSQECRKARRASIAVTRTPAVWTPERRQAQAERAKAIQVRRRSALEVQGPVVVLDEVEAQVPAL